MKFFTTVQRLDHVLLILLFGGNIFSALSSSADCPQNCKNVPSFELIGMNTINKYKCIRWNEGKYADEKKSVKFLNTTFCVVNAYGKFWCSAINQWNWDYCEYPPCKYYSTGCVQHWSATNYSVTVSLKIFLLSRDYLVVAYDESYECLLHKYCSNSCDMANFYIHPFFSQCKTEHSNQTASNIVFHSLKQNSIYRIYVIPITEPTRVPDLTFIMVKTHIARPSTPFDIKTNSTSSTALEIIWKKPLSNGTFGDSSGYSVTIYGDPDEIRSVTEESIEINGLNPCQSVSVSVEAINAAGNSDTSKINFFKTKPMAADVKFHPVKTQQNNKVIIWDYEEGSCKAEFIVKHKEKNAVEWSTNTTSKRFAILSGLVRNRIYSVSVQARVRDDDTGSVVYGNNTTTTFYTGKDRIELDNVKISKNSTNFLISWKMNQDNFDAVLSIIVVADDIHGRCSLFAILKKYIVFSDDVEYGKTLDSFRNNAFRNCFTMHENYSSKGGHEFFHSWPIYSTAGLQKYRIFAQTRIGIHNVTEGFVDSYDVPRIDPKFSAMTLLWLLLVVPFICAAVGCFVKKVQCRKIYHRTLNVRKLTNYLSRKRGAAKKYSFSFHKPSSISVDETELILQNFKKKCNRRLRLDQFSDFFSSEKQDEFRRLLDDYSLIKTMCKEVESKYGLTTNAAKLAENRQKNKYENILAYDHSRVVLQLDHNKSDYINANFVSLNNSTDYIASQGPLLNTVSDFWTMIWQQNVTGIVMLTKTYENDELKCVEYWPSIDEEQETFGDHNEFIISNKDEIQHEGFVERILSVKHKETGQQRDIIQLQMTTWADYSAPDENDFEGLLFRFHELTVNTISPPYLIHCSAGVGRTGTFITLDRLIRNIIDGEQYIDVNSVILQIRLNRMMMVQRKVQYVFIHKFLQFFLSKYTEREATEISSSENVYFNE